MLGIVAFRSNILDLGLHIINGIKLYVCMHLRLYVTHGTFLQCVGFGTSLIMYMDGDLGLYAFKLNLYGVCNSWNIMYGLCMHAFEVVSIPLNLCRVYNFWNIINYVCVWKLRLVLGQTSLWSL
jgi:hypothetical protein